MLAPVVGSPMQPHRLFVEMPLAAGADVAPSPEQAHYLRDVLRLKPGARVLLFNGRDGEWAGEVAEVTKKVVRLIAAEQTRRQRPVPDLHYLFAPLKRARLDYMAQKATEMGASMLRPVITRHTIAERVNLDRLRANAIEAAEQCGLLGIPDVEPPSKLGAVLDAWDPARPLIYCDEAAPIASPLDALARIPRGPLALLIGPEGGFAPEERDGLRARPFVTVISLGPRVMRADTAAVAALAVVNAAIGDWR